MSVKSFNEANHDRFAGDEVKHKNLKDSKAKRHGTKQTLRSRAISTDLDDWDDAYDDFDNFEKFGSKR